MYGFDRGAHRHLLAVDVQLLCTGKQLRAARAGA